MNDNMQAIRDDYCGSELSIRAVAAKHNLSPGRICQLAKEQGWPARSLNASGVEPTEDAAEVAAEVANEITSETTTRPVDGEPVSGSVSTGDDLSDAALDRGARITLTRAQAEGMAMSMRELAVRVTVAEADAHPDFHEAIGALKIRRREAIQRHRAAAAQAFAAVRAGQSAAERIETLRRERAEREADFPSLAVAFAMGNRDVAALAEHRQIVESVDDQLAAIKAAVPLLEKEARRLMSSTESIARAPDDIGQELANVRGAAACAIARAKW
jgi:hypothetical protein